MEPCSALTMASFDSVCSGYLVSVPSDRYNGTIGVIFSDDFVTKNFLATEACGNFIVMAYYLMSLFRQVRAKTKKGWQALNSCHPS